MTKKAVSPLIATVILVALAMTLGVIVINFTQSSTNDLKDSASKLISRDMKCSLDISLQVLEVGDERYLCYNRSGTNNLEVILENQGGTDAQGIRVFLLDYDDNPTTRDMTTSIGSHNRTKFNINITKNDMNTNFVFPPSKLLISAMIRHPDNSVDICIDNRIDVEEFEVCD